MAADDASASASNNPFAGTDFQEEDTGMFDPNKYLIFSDDSPDKTPSPPQILDAPAKEDEFSSLCKAVGGPIGNLLLKNDQLLDQVALSPANPKFPENVKLLRKVRENILTIMELSKMDEPPEFKNMPPLPELDEELAIRVLNIDPAKDSRAP